MSRAQVSSGQGRSFLFIALLISGFTVLACSYLDTNIAREHPWTAQPIRQETKEFFCTKFGLSPTHPVCQSNKDIFAADLLPIVQERFPVNTTVYSDVATVLDGYPVDIQNTTAPDGVITSRRYVYLLTEFDGFCVYFSMRDVQSGIIERIYSSSIGSGPTPDTCTSLKVREATRPWLLKPKPDTRATIVP